MCDAIDQDAPCVVCGSPDAEEVDMIFCDRCDCCTHLTCLEPPITRVPAGAWFCAKCRQKKRPAQYRSYLTAAPDRLQSREEATVNKPGLPTLDDLHVFLQHRHARGTRTKYGRAWARYESFGAEVERDVSDAETVALYVLWRLRHGVAYSTLRGEISGLLDRVPRLRGHVLIAQTLQAAKRLALVPKKTKTPLSLDQMQDLLDTVRSDREGRDWQLRNTRDWLFYLAAFLGFFRGSELCSLRWGDLSFEWEGPQGRFEEKTPTPRAGRVLAVTVHIRQSKTDPGAEGQLVRLAANPERPEWCPVFLFCKLWNRLGSPGPETTVFASLVDGKPLATDTMRSRFKKRMEQLLPEPGLVEQYSLHSLRRGGATAAMAAGVPYRLVKRQGRWRSDVAQLYMWASDDELLQVSAKLLTDLQ